MTRAGGALVDRRALRVVGWFGGRAFGIGVLVGLVGACGGPGPATPRARIGEIHSAIAAVEGQAGGAQVYSEINATETEVNLFVVRDGKELAYVVHEGKLDVPTSGQAFAGPTFDASQVVFQPGVLDLVAKQLPDSEIAAFSVTPDPSGGVEYIATVRARGAELRALLDSSGAVRSVG